MIFYTQLPDVFIFQLESMHLLKIQKFLTVNIDATDSRGLSP